MSHSEMAQPPRDDDRDDDATDDDEPDAQRLRMARVVEANWCAAWASLGRLASDPRSLVDDTPTMLRDQRIGHGAVFAQNASGTDLVEPH